MKIEQKLCALVIDDNVVSAMILAHMLELFEIHADTAVTGVSAMPMIRNSHYDIIFVDHIMPELDGVQTTAAIRNTTPFNGSIIALTSDITEDIRSSYAKAGANGVYSKPLEPDTLHVIIRNLQMDQDKEQILGVDKRLNVWNGGYHPSLQLPEEIDYEAGIKVSSMNPDYYVHVLELSVKDLQASINIIGNSFKNNSVKEFRVAIHNLRNILANTGAVTLSEEAANIEKSLQSEDVQGIGVTYDDYFKRIKGFYIKLKSSLDSHNKKVQRKDNCLKRSDLPMTKEEYEQCISNTIYYIKRYEFDAIVKELEVLMYQGPSDFRHDFEQILELIRRYQYEEALARLIEVKK